MTKHTNSKGFTIVELLIVIVVIAILAAITIVAYNGIQNRAHTTANKTAAENLAKKIESYNAIKNTYPAESTAADFVSELNSVTDSSLQGSGITVVDKDGVEGGLPDGTVGLTRCAPASGSTTTGYVLWVWDSTVSPAEAVVVQAGGTGQINNGEGDCEGTDALTELSS